MNIIILGPPGSGKGTQSRILHHDHGFYHFIMSDVLRHEVKIKSKIGEQIKSVIDAGNLLDDEMICGLLMKYVDDQKTHNSDGHLAHPEKHVVFDGIPRTIEQAQYLNKILHQKLNQAIDLIINLEVNEKLLYSRINDRVVCEGCSASYMQNMVQSDTCPHCEAKLIKRSDDNTEVLVKRLSNYNNANKNIIEYYKNTDIPFITIDGSNPVEIVTETIAKEIQKIKQTIIS